MKEVDQGALYIYITGPAFQLFYFIELCMRLYFTSNNTTNMDNTFQDCVIKFVHASILYIKQYNKYG